MSRGASRNNRLHPDLNMGRTHSGIPGSKPLAGDGYTRGLGNQYMSAGRDPRKAKTGPLPGKFGNPPASPFHPQNLLGASGSQQPPHRQYTRSSSTPLRPAGAATAEAARTSTQQRTQSHQRASSTINANTPSGTPGPFTLPKELLSSLQRSKTPSVNGQQGKLFGQSNSQLVSESPRLTGRPASRLNKNGRPPNGFPPTSERRAQLSGRDNPGDMPSPTSSFDGAGSSKLSRRMADSQKLAMKLSASSKRTIHDSLNKPATPKHQTPKPSGVPLNSVPLSPSKRTLGRQSAESSESIVGYHSVGGVAPGFYKENQDAYLYKRLQAKADAEAEKRKTKDFFAAVMDGHGMNGKKVSGFVKQALSQEELQRKLEKDGAEEALRWAFEKTANDLKSSSIDCRESGSTTISCLRQGNNLITANVGDSRAVLARLDGSSFKAVDLSNDHKPNRRDEMERIVRMRGQVEPSRAMGGRFIGPARVWAVKQQVGGLAVSRAIGDTNLNCVGVIPTPEITKQTVGEKDKFVILASDGVWEHLSSQEAVDVAKKHWNDPKKASDALVSKAREAWAKERCGYRDDITAVVVKLE